MKRIKQIAITVLGLVLFVGAQGVPAHSAEGCGKHPGARCEKRAAEIAELRQRLEALETNQSTMEKEFGSLNRLDEMVEFSGVLEAEASFESTDEDGVGDQSDLSLATAELTAEITVNENISGHVTLLYEEGETDLEVDEAVISLQGRLPFLQAVPLTCDLGLQYVPFGKFNSHFVSDPLTLELGEARDTALMVGTELGMMDFQIGAFSGDVDDQDNSTIDSLVAAVSATPLEGVEFGVSYISDIAESDAELVDGEYKRSVPGFGVFLSATKGAFTLEAEYLAALKSFANEDEVSDDLTGDRPAAWNLELAYAATEALEVAVKMEQADDYLNDLTRYGVAGSYGFSDAVSLSLEYLYSEEDEAAEIESHVVTAQLALEF